MAAPQKIIPHKGVDLDNSELYIDDMKAVFMKNMGCDAEDNERIGMDEGSNQFVFTPLESNTRYCNMQLPEGANYACGFYYSTDLNQAFGFVYNTLGNHLIYTMYGADGSCQKIVQSSCLAFRLDPKHFVSEGRCHAAITCYFNKKRQKTETRTQLIYTINDGEVRAIFVEDCIATQFFDPTTFPFFDVHDTDCFRCNLTNLGVPEPVGCIQITPVARNLDDPTELEKVNRLLNQPWRFRIKYVDVWGRESEWGDPSEMYIPTIGGACAPSVNARCLKLKFNAGCPTVDRIMLAYSNWTGNIRGLSTETDWYRTAIIEKYNSGDNVEWWERTLNSSVVYDPLTNTIEYTFCADGERVPIDVNETNRNENPLPQIASTVFPVGKSVALGRNVRGFEKLDLDELSKVQFGVIPPTAGAVCKPEARKIIFYALFYSWGDDKLVRLRTKDGRTVFGSSDCSNNNPFAYDQVLPDGQEGIIGCLRGTKNYAISKQCRYDTVTGNIEEVGMNWPINSNPAEFNRYFAIQKFEFDNVLPGEYVFQISSHKATPSDDYMRMSTYTVGRTTLTNPTVITVRTKEIRFNCCSGDVHDKEPLMIYDLTREGKGCAVADATSVNAGYLYEDEVNKVPIEMARVVPNIGSAEHSGHTDHNGFYWAVTRQRGLRTSLYGYKNCAANQELAFGRASSDTADNWYKFDKVYAYKSTTLYPVKDRILLKGKLVDCNNNTAGIAGALVVLTRGNYAITDSTGHYTIIVHDIGEGGLRNDVVIFSQQGKCHLTSCVGSCNYCLPSQNFQSIACNNSPRTVTMQDQGANVNAATKKGPKMGGRYMLGLVLKDWMGRKTFVQSMKQHEVNIPTLQETQIFDFSKITFDLDGCQFPTWVKRVNFYISENQNFDEWEVWVAERVQYVDNSGKPNKAAPTQIRLYYESLGEYQNQNTFSTNVNWQFIDDADKTILGDYVEFLAKADGTIFPSRITALVKHDKQGKYIQIDYTEELAGLEDGVLIQFVRPTAFNNTNQFFYSLCPDIKVQDRRGVQQTGVFNFFDSYLHSRQIPVPVEIKKTNDDGEIETSTDVQVKNYPFYYEHHSPSDFWGDHAWSKGRVSTKNLYERRYCRLMEVAVSKALANNGVVNGLHYFDEADIRDFETEYGAIIVGLAENNTVLFICERDNFVSIYNDPGVEVDELGRVQAPNAADKFGRPIRKIGNDFGCQMIDINTIRKRNGIVMFLDRQKEALVKHNYNEAVDVSLLGVKSWLISKINHVRNFNVNAARDGLKYFHGIIDPKTNKYLLSSSYIEPVLLSSGSKACPEGYVLSQDETTCSKVETVEPISQQVAVKAAASRHPVYSEFGTRIYDNGFTIDGVGTAQEIPAPHAFWSNGDNSPQHGPMNRNGIWVDNDGDGIRDALTPGAQLTVTFSLNSSAQKIFYFGIGGDNKARLTVNGVVIVNRDNSSTDINFKWWHIYPVLLHAGPNLISITGEGDGSVQDSMAMEIYENTPDQIAAANNYGDLTVRFRTGDLVGGTLQVTNCPDGYQPVDDGSGNWVCQRIVTTPSAPVGLPIDIADEKFINNLPGPLVTANETKVYCIDKGQWEEDRAYTPELFGFIEGDIYGAQLISFRKGEAWRHHQLLNPGNTFNNFYGTQTDAYIEIVFNLDNTKVKNFLWNEVYCKEVQFYCDRIITESGQQSRLMPLWWERRDKFWAADFKCALNTPGDTMIQLETGANALLDGDPLYGRWLKARYKIKSTDRGRYFELTGIIGFMNGAEKSSG
jgi:hypothetical protein